MSDHLIAYRITDSTVDSVKVDHCIIAESDYWGDRTWNVYNPFLSRAYLFFTGTPVRELCFDCRANGKIRGDLHPGSCEDGPQWMPDWEVPS